MTRAATSRGAHGAAALAGGAAAYTCGAMAGKLAAAGHLGDAARWVAPLVTELATAQDTQAQAHLVGALGNAGLPEHTAAIAGFAASGDEAVRAAVASALRHGEGEPRARSALVLLSADPDAHVQAMALASLRDYQLGDDDARALVGSLAAGVPPTAAGDAVAVLAAHAASPEVAAALRRIGDDTAIPPSVRAEIERLLAAGS